MALYLIGDVQGCDAPLARLLHKIDFSPSRDTLYLLGDLVNRGPDSDAVLRRLGRPSAVSRSWIVAGAPTSAERERYERTLSAQVLVLETPADECIRRIAADPIRAESGKVLDQVIREWWSTYRRRATGDTVVRWVVGAAA